MSSARSDDEAKVLAAAAGYPRLVRVVHRSASVSEPDGCVVSLGETLWIYHRAPSESKGGDGGAAHGSGAAAHPAAASFSSSAVAASVAGSGAAGGVGKGGGETLGAQAFARLSWGAADRLVHTVVVVPWHQHAAKSGTIDTLAGLQGCIVRILEDMASPRDPLPFAAAYAALVTPADGAAGASAAIRAVLDPIGRNRAHRLAAAAAIADRCGAADPGAPVARATLSAFLAAWLQAEVARAMLP